MDMQGRPGIVRPVFETPATSRVTNRVLPWLARWLVAWALMGSWAGSAMAQVDWDAEISIDLKRASLRETLASFAKIGGGELWMEPSVSGEVTLKTDGSSAFEILDRICKHHDLRCFWGGRPARLVVEASEGFQGFATSISLSLRLADLQQTVEVMSTITDGKVRIEGELMGKVSVEILSAPWPVALGHICEDAGCEVDWSKEPFVVSPRARSNGADGPELVGDPVDRKGRIGRIDARVDALVGSAPSAAWGPLRLEVEGAAPEGALKESDSGSAKGRTTWGEHFSRLCEAHDCRWQLRFGQPSTLLLTWLDPRVKGRVKLGTETRWDTPRAWPARTLASRLARELGVELVASEGLGLDGEVNVRQPELRWIELADSLCRVLRCRWRVEGGKLLLSPTEAPLSLMPTVSAPAVETRLSVTGSDGVGLEQTATFDWKRPVNRWPLSSGPASEKSRVVGALVAVWIPFSPEVQWVLPVWLPCTGMPEILPSSPVGVGSTEAEISVQLGLALGSESLGDDSASAAEMQWPACLAPQSSDPLLSVALAEHQDGKRVRESRFTLDAMPGSYLMIAPPGASDGSATAVIFLGSDSAGRVLAAVVRAASVDDPAKQDPKDRLDRSGPVPPPTVELLTLDQVEQRSLVRGQRAYRLSLIPGKPPSG